MSITGFDELVTKITDALHFVGENKIRFETELKNKFENENDKFKLLQNIDIENLLKADSDLHDLEPKLKPYYDKVKENWESMLYNLGKLQAIIFLKKLEEPTNNCGEIVNDITKALDNKINIVNKILEENIKTSQLEKQHKQKYLKYKTKYLHLKNKLI